VSECGSVGVKIVKSGQSNERVRERGSGNRITLEGDWSRYFGGK
jgi:hypothetical protein